VRAYKTQEERFVVELGRIEKFTIWTCDKCSAKYDESGFNNCEAPMYMTKAKAISKEELSRTARAIRDGHPLTQREEKIARVMPPSLIEQLSAEQETDPNRPVNPISGEPIKGSKETYSEYLKRREEWLLSQQ
jgi:hypothetical protein